MQITHYTKEDGIHRHRVVDWSSTGVIFKCRGNYKEAKLRGAEVTDR